MSYYAEKHLDSPQESEADMLHKENQAMRAAERVSRTAIDFLEEIVHVVDNALTIVLVNCAFEQWRQRLGLSADCVGKPIKEALPFISMKSMDEYRQVVQSGEMISTEETYERGGEYCFMEVRKVPVSENGGVIRVITVMRDVSDRRRAAEALQYSEETLNSILRNVPDIIYRLDPEGRIVFISQAIQKYGYSSGALMGCKLMDLVNPDDKARARRRINERRTGERSTRDLEVRFLNSRAVGAPVWEGGAVREGSGGFPWEPTFLISAEGLYGNGAVNSANFKGTQGIARDIGVQKRERLEKSELEEKLQRSEKMEALGRLAGGVAHDLNNILSAIIGHPDLILLNLPPDSPIRRNVEAIQKAGRRAVEIVQDLLTMARRGVIVNKVVNLNDIIHEYLKSPECEKLCLIHYLAAIETHLEVHLCNMKGSPVHLTKALMNLVGNAAEAMPSGGVISIKTSNRHIDFPLKSYDLTIPEGDYVVLEVADSGVGIEAQDLPRIFEPFYTRKKMGRSGSGLGMAVVWAAVKDHKGNINVRSTPGQGSTFELYFPITREALEMEILDTSIERALGNGEKILVVDDMEEQREIAAMLLTRLGYSVFTVSSGEEAVDFLKKNSVELVILDMLMEPGMDGLDTYRQLVRMEKNPITIISSGYIETERVKETYRLGAVTFLKKPFTLHEIATVVKNELDKRRLR